MGLETAELVSIGLTAASTGASVAAASGRGKAAAAQAQRNAQIDKQNAAIRLQEQRERSLERRREGRKLASKIRAITAAGGFAQEGTPLLLQTEAIKTAELDAQEEERIGLIEAGRLRESANLSLLRGQTARSAARLEQFGSIVEGGAKIAGILNAQD